MTKIDLKTYISSGDNVSEEEKRKYVNNHRGVIVDRGIFKL